MKRASAQWIVVLAALFFLNGCAVLSEFKPAVAVSSMSPAQYIALKRGDILTDGKLSAATLETIRAAGLDSGACAKPESATCIAALTDIQDVTAEQRLSALSELWLNQAQTLTKSLATSKDESNPTVGDPRLNAWLEVARLAYGYLFFSERTPDARAFEDRQTQVRDYYNLAVQEAASLVFASYRGRSATNAQRVFHNGAWTITFAAPDSTNSNDQDAPLPQELLSASSLSFAGLWSTFRRDGFGGELVAVMTPDPVTKSTPDPNASAKLSDPQAQSIQSAPTWSEMPTTAITALLRFAGNDLPAVLATHQVVLSIHDPYRQARVQLHGQNVPLAANFTANYGLWLARSGFNKQSIRSLFGRENGIERPHLYLMQPYDPRRRIILMIHGLASSPEAWVNVANELMGDEVIRNHFQIWQFYYPTNLPIALNHYEMRQTLQQTLQHFDPSGSAAASHDMVVIGHSMGGVIARLMASSSQGEALWDELTAGRSVDDVQLQRLRERIGPMLHFEPLPELERAIFIAAPHQGTDVAGGRLGRAVGRLVSLPVSVLKRFDELSADPPDGGGKKGHSPKLTPPNSIDNLDRRDPFVRAAAKLPISPCIPYHSIIAQANTQSVLSESDDGLVPYWSSHLDGAQSEKVVHSAHSVQETAPAIIELRRILHQDIRGPSPSTTSDTGQRKCPH